jgi:hypothetical protein
MSFGHPQKCTNKKEALLCNAPLRSGKTRPRARKKCPLCHRDGNQRHLPCTSLGLKLAGFRGNVQSSVNSEPYSIVAYYSIILPENVKKIPDIGKNYPVLIVSI